MKKMTKKMEPMRKKTRPPMGTTMPPPRSRKARQEVRAAELRVRPDAGKCGKGHAQQTTDSVGPHQLRRSDAIFFIDNEAACAAMIRGSSKEPDVGAIVNAVHWLLYQADCRAWFEWIDSSSNCSDGLSRDGLKDAWTLAQKWNLKAGEVPPWNAVTQCKK